MRTHLLVTLFAAGVSATLSAGTAAAGSKRQGQPSHRFAASTGFTVGTGEGLAQTPIHVRRATRKQGMKSATGGFGRSAGDAQIHEQSAASTGFTVGAGEGLAQTPIHVRRATRKQGMKSATGGFGRSAGDAQIHEQSAAHLLGLSPAEMGSRIRLTLEMWSKRGGGVEGEMGVGRVPAQHLEEAVREGHPKISIVNAKNPLYKNAVAYFPPEWQREGDDAAIALVAREDGAFAVRIAK